MNLLILRKIGANTSRLAPWNYKGKEALKRYEWESKPDEIYVQQEKESDKDILKLYPDYEIALKKECK